MYIHTISGMATSFIIVYIVVQRCWYNFPGILIMNIFFVQCRAKKPRLDFLGKSATANLIITEKNLWLANLSILPADASRQTKWMVEKSFERKLPDISEKKNRNFSLGSSKTYAKKIQQIWSKHLFFTIWWKKNSVRFSTF